MDRNDYWIPRTLDAPPLLFMWEFDTAMIYIGWLGLGLSAGMLIPSIILAFITGRGYAKLKDEGGRGLMLRFLYWFTPSALLGFSKLDSAQREYFGG